MADVGYVITLTSEMGAPLCCRNSLISCIAFAGDAAAAAGDALLVLNCVMAACWEVLLECT
jgi:hypothetical protein